MRTNHNPVIIESMSLRNVADCSFVSSLCQNITIQYNRTIFPNLLGHTRQVGGIFIIYGRFVLWNFNRVTIKTVLPLCVFGKIGRSCARSSSIYSTNQDRLFTRPEGMHDGLCTCYICTTVSHVSAFLVFNVCAALYDLGLSNPAMSFVMRVGEELREDNEDL